MNADHTSTMAYALSLFNDPDDIVALVPYISISEILRRLQMLPKKYAQFHINQLNQSFETFTTHCANLLKQQGIMVTSEIERKQNNIFLSKGRRRVGMASFYTERQNYATQDEFDNVFLEWVKNGFS